MEKVVYKNKTYIFIVTMYISFLFLKNTYKMFATQDMFAAAVSTVQAIVLYQIYLKDLYVKVGIKLWTAFPIVKEGVLLGVDFMRLISGGEKNIVLDDTMNSAFFFVAAILIYVFCDKAIKIVES